MKDVGGCEKLRGVANRALIRRFPNGETRRGEQLRHLRPEFIGPTERTRGSETSQYPEEKKTMSDSRSSGERNGNSLNRPHESDAGVAGPQKDRERLAEAPGKVHQRA